MPCNDVVAVSGRLSRVSDITSVSFVSAWLVDESSPPSNLMLLQGVVPDSCL